MYHLKSAFLFLLSVFICGCFVNYPVYYDNIVKTEKSLPGFVAFLKEKQIRYRSSLGSPRVSGMMATSLIPLESYADIFADQVPGKAGNDIEQDNYQALPADFFGAPTGRRPVPIKGRIRLHGDKAIIIVHGIFFSKRTRFIKDFTQAALRYGFSVVTVDLRGHGENLVYPEMSLGIYEALDLCYLAKKLKLDYGMKYVGLLGFSLGAHTVIRTAYEASCAAKAENAPPVVDAVLAISPPCDMQMAFEDLSCTGFARFTNNFFDGVFLTRIDHLKQNGFIPKTLPVENFADYLQKIILPHYGTAHSPTQNATAANYQHLNAFREKIYGQPYLHLDLRTRFYEKLFRTKIKNPDDLLQAAGTYDLLPDIDRVPLLVIHGYDDTTVSVKHTQMISNRVNSEKLQNILTIIVPDGGHIAIHKVDPDWTFNVVYAFHYYYAYPERRNTFRPLRRVSPLWYYFDRVFYPTQLRMLWTLF